MRGYWPPRACQQRRNALTNSGAGKKIGNLGSMNDLINERTKSPMMAIVLGRNVYKAKELTEKLAMVRKK